MIIFYAHGGGLGHLTRIDQFIENYKIPKDQLIIITPSVFTHYFDGYNFVKIDWNDSVSRWSNMILETIYKYNITTFYVDTFPYGMKGELNKVYRKFPTLKYIYISRVLKWSKYCDSVSFDFLIKFKSTILLEKLYKDHLIWIKENSDKLTMIELKYKNDTSIQLFEYPYVMVVHSGGKESVIALCKRAIKDFSHDATITIALFTQVDIKSDDFNDPRLVIFKDRHPVSMYYDDAKKIYTAAGFNSINELKTYAHKHVVDPIDKLYDDQFFRVEN